MSVQYALIAIAAVTMAYVVSYSIASAPEPFAHTQCVEPDTGIRFIPCEYAGPVKTRTR